MPASPRAGPRDGGLPGARTTVRTYPVPADLAPLSAVVADDQPLLRDGIASLLELSGAKVVGRCENAADLMLKVRSYAPDVAVVDIRMPPTFTDEGLRAAAEIRASVPAPACSCSPNTWNPS